MSQGGRHDILTLVQRQLVLRILPSELLEQVRTSVSNGCFSQDIQIYRDDEQPSPPFQPAMNERMSFVLYNKKYPASLVDLPCPVETHRTFDLTTTYKSSDVSQILIVYDDDDARLQAELDMRPRKGELFYGNPQGLTPPSSNVAKRRFIPAKSKLMGYSKKEVEAVEAELVPLFEGWQTGRSEKSNNSQPIISVGTEGLPQGSVVIFDEEEVVDFEEFMWSERYPNGRTFREGDEIAKKHPEIFLPTPKEGVKKTTNQQNKKDKKNKKEKEKSNIASTGLPHQQGKTNELNVSSVGPSPPPSSKKTADGIELDEDNLMNDIYMNGGFDFDLEADMAILSDPSDAPESLPKTPSDKTPGRPTSRPTPPFSNTSPPTVRPSSTQKTTNSSSSPPLLSSSSSLSSSSTTTTFTPQVVSQQPSAFNASLQQEEMHPNPTLPNPSSPPQEQPTMMEVDTQKEDNEVEVRMDYEQDEEYCNLKKLLETAENEKKSTDAKLKVIQEKHAETRNPVMKRRFEQDLNEARSLAESANQNVEAKKNALIQRENELKQK